MSTAPVVPVISTSWLKAHETLLIVFMLLASFGWLGNKYLDRKATETAATAAVATQQAAEARSQAALAAQDYKVALDAMTTAIAALNHNVAQRTVVLQAKQTAIKTEPVPEVTAEWQTLIGTSGEIIPRTDGKPGAAVTEDVVRLTVGELESVSTLQGNLTDETQIAKDTQQELDKANALVVSLKVEVTDNDTACKDQIAAIKATDRKSKRNWFIAGFLTGIGTRLLWKF